MPAFPTIGLDAVSKLAVRDFIDAQRITVWYSVPSALVRLGLHGDLDQILLIDVAQCRHYQAMLSDPVAAPYVKQALAIARFDPGMFEVVKVFDGPSGPDAVTASTFRAYSRTRYEPGVQTAIINSLFVTR